MIMVDFKKVCIELAVLKCFDENWSYVNHNFGSFLWFGRSVTKVEIPGIRQYELFCQYLIQVIFTNSFKTQFKR